MFIDKENFNLLSKNPKLPLGLVYFFPDKPWNWQILAKCQQLSYAIICFEKIFEKNLDLRFISKNPNVTCEIIEKYINSSWCWKELSKNPNITCEFVDKYINMPWCWRHLSFNKNITIDFLKKHIKSENLLYECLSRNPHITHKYIKKNPSEFWNYNYIMANTQTKLEKINLDKYYNYTGLLHRPDITWEFIQKLHISQYKTNKWTLISQHPCVTWDIITANYDLPWDWSAVSENPNITLEIVKSTTPSPECPRPMLSPCWNKKIIEKRFYNSDVYDKNTSNIFTEENIRKYFAAKTLWRYWFRAITNPEYTICRKRLLRELKD